MMDVKLSKKNIFATKVKVDGLVNSGEDKTSLREEISKTFGLVVEDTTPGVYVDAKGVWTIKVLEDIWPQYQANTRRTGISYYDVTIPKGNVVWVTDLMEAENAEAYMSNPIVGGSGKIYVVVGSYLYALGYGGDILWKVELSAETSSTPAIDDKENIYVLTQRGTLTKVYSDGVIAWSKDINQNATSALAVYNNKYIYFATYDNVIYCYDTDGNEIWSKEMDPPPHYSGAFMTGAVTDDGVALFVQNKWVGSPAGGQSYSLYALDNNGNIVWSSGYGRTMGSMPVVGDSGNIYIYEHTLNSSWGVMYSRVAAYDKDGNNIWRSETIKGAKIYPSLCCGENIIVVSYDVVNSATQHNVVMFSKEGEKIWSVDVGASICNTLTSTKLGYIFAVGCDGKVYAIDKTGKIVASWNIGSITTVSKGSGATISADGRLFVSLRYSIEDNSSFALLPAQEPTGSLDTQSDSASPISPDATATPVGPVTPSEPGTTTIKYKYVVASLE